MATCTCNMYQGVRYPFTTINKINITALFFKRNVLD